MNFFKVPGSFFLIVTTTLLVACGGGGGSDSFVGAGNISVQVSPKTVDTGDRVKVTAEFSDLHPDGVSIKFRYPSGLVYIADTSIWTIDNRDIDGAPSIETAADQTQSTFLVYYLGRDLLDDNDSGSIEFELRGVSATSENSKIEVDIDVLEADPEFSADNPEFSAEDSADLRVK